MSGHFSRGPLCVGINGVDDLRVRRTASGELIRFSWRVVDPARAQALSDKKATPYLIQTSTGAKMELAHAERVGQLRQVATPGSGREYWMAFFNSRQAVKPGSQVDVVIGRFRAKGLTVE
jgi:hypothetical protein